MPTLENVITISEVLAGSRFTRQHGTGYEVDVRGQDIEIYWTALAPRGYGYGAQPYNDSQYGGTFPPNFLGWRIEVSMYDEGNGNGERQVVASYETGPRSMELRYHEFANVAHAATLGLGFQSVVRFEVWPLTNRGRGESQYVETASWSNVVGRSAPGPPKVTATQWQQRPFLFHCPGEDPVALTFQSGIASPTAKIIRFLDQAGSENSHITADGEWSSIGAIADVDLTGLSNGEGLIYNSGTGNFEPGSVGGGGGSYASLSDVDLTGLANNDLTAWDSSASKFVDVTPDGSILVNAAAGTIVVNAGSHLVVITDIDVDLTANFSWSGTHVFSEPVTINTDSTGLIIKDTTDTVAGAIHLFEKSGNGTNKVTFRAPNSLAGDLIMVVPSTAGSSGEFLHTDGAGTTSWADLASAFTDPNSHFAQTAFVAILEEIGFLKGDSLDTWDTAPESPGAWSPDASTKIRNVTVARFRNAASDAMSAAFRVPLSYDGGNITVILHMSASSTPGPTQLTTDMDLIHYHWVDTAGDGVTPSGAFTTAIDPSLTTSYTADDVMARTFTISSNLPTRGGMMNLRILRTTGDAYNGAIDIHAVTIKSGMLST